MRKHLLLYLIGILFLTTNCSKESSDTVSPTTPAQEADRIFAAWQEKQKPIVEKILSTLTLNVDQGENLDISKEEKKEFFQKMLFGSLEEVTALIKKLYRQNNGFFNGFFIFILLNPTITEAAYKDPNIFFMAFGNNLQPFYSKISSEQAQPENSLEPPLIRYLAVRLEVNKSYTKNLRKASKQTAPAKQQDPAEAQSEMSLQALITQYLALESQYYGEILGILHKDYKHIPTHDQAG